MFNKENNKKNSFFLLTVRVCKDLNLQESVFVQINLDSYIDANHAGVPFNNEINMYEINMYDFHANKD